MMGPYIPLLLLSLAHILPSVHGLKIVFGSCNKQGEEQPFWDIIAERRPDKLLLTGDNIYADIRDFGQFFKLFSKHSIFRPAPPEHIVSQYEILAQHPGFQRAMQTVGWANVLTTYDDHDYGLNDGDKTYEFREQSRQLFLDFWREPKASERRNRDGVYTSSVHTDGTHIIKYIILDERYNKDPYDTPNGDFLGERQWQWLEQELRDESPDVVLLVSSIQLFADDKLVGEFWAKFPAAKERMTQLLASSPVPNIFVISGDVHYAEISEMRCGSRNLLDITSSGMTHSWTHGGFARSAGYVVFQAIFPAHYRRQRFADQFGGLNIGELDIKWHDDAESSSIGTLSINILDHTGQTRIRREVKLRPKGYYSSADIGTCEPYWGPVKWYQKLFLWGFLASILVLFVIFPVITVMLWLTSIVVWYYFKYKTWRDEQKRKKRD